MGIQHWKQDGIPVAELTGPEKRIVDAPSALELAMTARHEAGASALLVDKAAVAEDFFILSTGLAGRFWRNSSSTGSKWPSTETFPAIPASLCGILSMSPTTGATFSLSPSGKRRFGCCCGRLEGSEEG